LRDVAVLWPPDAVWEALRSPKRLELAGGVALITITLLITMLRERQT